MDYPHTTILLLLLILLVVVGIYYLTFLRNQRSIRLARELLSFFSSLSEKEKPEATRQLLHMLELDEDRIIESFCFSIFKKAGFDVSPHCLFTSTGQAYRLAKDVHGKLYLVIVSKYKHAVGYEELSAFSRLIQHHQAMAGYYVHAANPDMVNDTYFGFTNIQVVGVHQLVALLSPAFIPIPN